MIRNRSMPPGVFIPTLAYRSVPEAADWLCRVFGFQERLRIGDHRVQLVYGGASMVVTESATDAVAVDMMHAVMVHVPDVDAHHARALQCGAKILGTPMDHPYGERQYAVEDIGGHRWVFTQSIADVDPAAWGGLLFDDA
ncbi:MAG TPA: VOC family protein [Dyella sp.]|uniref:VOC family protein n=1 Tax=Dyella sp. TaxID=1869338 RepID=UPI002D79E13A|nr:VOC family protein [Dyella sp.]HET6551992.1 VOC family protein [Dyella sp.]